MGAEAAGGVRGDCAGFVEDGAEMVLREVEIAGELIDADFEGFYEILQEDFTGVYGDEVGGACGSLILKQKAWCAASGDTRPAACGCPRRSCRCETWNGYPAQAYACGYSISDFISPFSRCRIMVAYSAA